ncbi:MAG: ABC transporter ATP-binding protein [Proteobacteria bacterium]|nr:ABC transporter ATP-binding protein [Pseudomonadota bacterium]MBU1452581.1 ABC transporter ATP-binding protein [Pseudomonadota bacterium]MBU2469232.1 ABC transporter ATP-binding protein [Pseudomonadota bacterium]MBU2517026.1 ABC transporter ATP-binding protein [Pseudomonadota bacterium]
MLSLVEVNTYYGTSHVLQDVSLGVAQGDVVALLGRNGVGKTTTLRTIMGLTPPATGGILFNGREVRAEPPWNKAKMGLAYMPDDLRIFSDLTCEENLDIAAYLVKRKGYWDKKKVMDLFPVLAERRGQKGLNMSGGEKKMLSLARALMSNPSVVLLDEASEGLAPMIVRSLAEAIGTIRSHGMTILLADQNLKFCRRVCDRGYIIEKGQIVHEGGMEEIWQDQEVVNKYLAL